MTSQRAAAPYEVVVVKADSNVNKEKTETLVSNVSICWRRKLKAVLSNCKWLERTCMELDRFFCLLFV